MNDARESRRSSRRRPAVCCLVCLAVVSLGGPWPGGAVAAPQPRFKAVAFDFLVLFDPDSVLPAVEEVFPGRGRELTRIWRTRQFEYAWLRSITGRYADFSVVTEDALVFAARSTNAELTPARTERLLEAYRRLSPWPDAHEALRRLRASGVRVIALANFSPGMLGANAEHAGLARLFEALVSTDENHTYKPDARAYRLGLERLHLAKQEILFVAFGGWDAAGAKAFGYPTAWVNRLRQPAEELGNRPDYVVPDLDGVLRVVLGDSSPLTTARPGGTFRRRAGGPE